MEDKNLHKLTETDNHSQESQEQLLDKITFEIITKMENGETINFAEYAASYPSLAANLQANIANYWLEDRVEIEQELAERSSPEYLAKLSQKLANPAEQQRVRASLSKIMQSATPATQHKATDSLVIDSLYKLGAAKKIAPPDLAKQVGLSSDLMMKVEKRVFEPESLPTELLNKLGAILGVTFAQLNHYFSTSPMQSGVQHFNLDKPEALTQQDFKQAIRDSRTLTAEQKAFWLQEIEKEAK